MAHLSTAMLPFISPVIHLDTQMATKLRLNPNARAEMAEPAQPYVSAAP